MSLPSGVFFALPVTLVLATAVGGVRAAEPERLISAEALPGGFVIRVRSSGCTDADSFRYDFERHALSGELFINVVRLQKDTCKAFIRAGVVIVAQMKSCGSEFFAYSKTTAAFPYSYSILLKRLREGSCSLGQIEASLNSASLGISETDRVVFQNATEIPGK